MNDTLMMILSLAAIAGGTGGGAGEPVNINDLVQNEGDDLILYGGTSSDEAAGYITPANGEGF